MKKTITASCILCKSNNAEVITDKLRYNLERPVCKCLSCGFIYMNPPFVEEGNTEYYEKEYRKAYNAPEAKEFFESQLEESKIRLQRIENYINKEMKILEVGCAAGSFLYTLQQSSYKNVEGLEIDRNYSEFAKTELNFTLHQKVLEENNFDENSYDVILCFHVLEHLPDPVAFLKNVKRILKPGGVFICEVPDVNDYLLTIFRLKSYQDFYFQPAHNYYFSARTLKKALQLAEFNNIKIKHIQRYSIFNGINWIKTGKPTGLTGGAPLNIFNKLINIIFSKLIMLFKKSDTILVFSKKNN